MTSPAHAASARSPTARWRLLGGGLLGLLLLITSLWMLARARTFQLFGVLVPRVATERPLVALTFDDGPTPRYTGEILDILAQARVPATFFITGAELEAHPEFGRQLLLGGHELGNHSYSHVRMVLRSPSFVRDELERTDALIRAAGQRSPILFRAPYCKKLFYLPWYLARTGRTHITWDIEPETDPAVGASAERIIAHVLERVRPGSIILLHVMYSTRRESMKAVPGLIAALRARGYEFRTVSQLLAEASGP